MPRASWISPTTGATYDTRWSVRLTHPALELDLSAELPNQELDTRQTTGLAYWEGAVSIAGVARGRRVSGRGYVEMTGYAPRPSGAVAHSR